MAHIGLFVLCKPLQAKPPSRNLLRPAEFEQAHEHPSFQLSSTSLPYSFPLLKVGWWLCWCLPVHPNRGWGSSECACINSGGHLCDWVLCVGCAGLFGAWQSIMGMCTGYPYVYYVETWCYVSCVTGAFWW